MSCFVAFHYRSYGTFFLHKNRLHNIYRGFTHYKYYRAKKRFITILGNEPFFVYDGHVVHLRCKSSVGTREKRGLVSCLDYYLERHALKVS